MMPHYREALVSDIPQLMEVRLSVKENVLSDPRLVTEKDNEEYLIVRGKGWVSEINNTIIGFAIADLKERNVWALFVTPHQEGKGIGKELHTMMIDWFFNQTKDTIWLTTAAFTRAEKFYKSFGLIETERIKKKPSLQSLPTYVEIKLEMTYECWCKIKSRVKR